ncbi:quinone oxidoreductase [[Flexibacter] sp. ATCC 35208]|uniref:quinone oxidoreductase family protein n=1 Tax=[Flexibacter] sp. ATCC 35208 TaxID=1936242 RepID=UPI0009C4DF2E|nr:quinone oxidoreductase [[Flexibacter] sp. ATCC 35208]OMP76137.1 alcohol dehydrogenase [[Flexibacter] sp. ATCC 35208]
MITNVVLIEETDKLKYQTVELRPPGPQEVLIRQKAIGVNYVDVFFRNGTFPVDAFPAPIGLEAAGIIEQVGDAVKQFAPGDRVAYYGTAGAYAEHKVLNENELYKLPDDITFEQAASVMVKGLTAHMLLKASHEVKAGEVVLVHAMMGGVGSLLSAWARSIGATVIGTVGNAAKKELALKRGFQKVINLQNEQLTEVVDVVYDGIGKTTFQQSLELIKPGGTAVLYGWPSGMPDIDTQWMEDRNIHFVTAVLNHYPAYQDKSGKAMEEIFDLIRKGVLSIENPTIYSLADAAKAHADLESRKTTGSIILQP